MSQKLPKSLSVLIAALISFFAVVHSASADRKIRIHFVAASYSFAKDEATNSNFSAYASRAGYDAIWEASVPSGLPNAFGEAKRVSGSGLTQNRSKNGIFDCDANLQFKNEASYPDISVYNINGDKYAIQIVAPHGSLLTSDTAAPCDAPIFVVQGQGEGVSTTPDYTGIPNEAGGSMPPPISQFAAFVIDADKPETQINFSFVQTADFPQLLYQSKSIWFGYVNVELNPNSQLPGAVDPLKLFNYTPPEGFVPPPDPPTGGNPGGGGGGGTTVTPKQITTYIRDPIIRQIVDTLQGLQQIWNLISQSQALSPATAHRSVARAYTDPNGGYTYDPVTRKLTLLSISGAPGDGNANVKIAVGDGGAKSSAKNLALTTSTQNIELTLPPTLTKAFDKGKKFPIEIEASFSTTGTKKVKASVSKKVSIKKRP